MWEPCSPSPSSSSAAASPPPPPPPPSATAAAAASASASYDSSGSGRKRRRPPPPPPSSASSPMGEETETEEEASPPPPVAAKGRGRGKGRGKQQKQQEQDDGTDAAAATATGKRPRGKREATADGATEEEEGKARGKGRHKRQQQEQEQEAADASGDGQPKTTAKAKPKATATRKRKPKGGAAVSMMGTHGLPGVYGRLFELYDAVDTACCFLIKSSLACSVSNVGAMVQQLYGGPPRCLTLTTEALGQLCAAAPQAIALHYVPVTDRSGLGTSSFSSSASEPPPAEGNDNDENQPQEQKEEEEDFRLELTFPTAGGVGNGHARRRRDMVREALMQQAIVAHEKFLASPAAASSSSSSSSSSQEAATAATAAGDGKQEDAAAAAAAAGPWDYGKGWHPAFAPETVDIEAAAAPTKPASLAEATSTDPYQAPPAPLVPPGVTGRGKVSAPAPSALIREDTGEEDDDGLEAPFNDTFLNNVPAEAVPKTQEECVGLDQVLPYLQSLPFYRKQVVHTREYPGAEGRYGEIDRPLEPALAAALEARGVTRLFQHQARGISALLSGRHLAVATATSSGKSVIYNTPVLQTILTSRAARALYLFPTKALAQDQLRALRELLAAHPDLAARVSVDTYDGDTPFIARSDIRDRTHILLSNPDMLHQSILPHHKQWSDFLASLRYVVIDEAHMYTGVFGAHVAGVLRRLLRLCLIHSRPASASSSSPSSSSSSQGGTLALPIPQFVACSATIANPREHFAHLLPLESLLGGVASLTVIDEDTSPRGRKVFVIWNPPLKEHLPAIRLAPPTEAASAAAAGGGGGQGRPQKAQRRHGSRRYLMKVAAARRTSRGKGTGASAVAAERAGDGEEEEVESVAVAAAASEEGKDAESAAAAAAAADGKGQQEEAESAAPEAESAAAAAADRQQDEEEVEEEEELAVLHAATQAEGEEALMLEEGFQEDQDQEEEEEEEEATAPTPAATQSLSSSYSSAVIDPPAAAAASSAGGNGSTDSEAAAAALSADCEAATAAVTAAAAAGGGGDEAATAALPPRRRSTIVEAAMLFSALVKQRVRTLAFCKVRKLVEMVLRYTLQDLKATAPALVPMVKGYRGGYTKEDRRAIEAELFGGQLLGVTATCALELGVDVGSLDVTLHTGFPGSASSLWQQAGRAGRAGRDSLAILICFDTPVDQYFAANPTELLEMPPERAVTDPTNPYALRAQLLCAADEGPIGGRYFPGCLDRPLFGEEAFDEAVAYLAQAGHLVGPLADGSYRKGEWLTHPQRTVSLRMIDPVTFEVVDVSQRDPRPRDGIDRGGRVIDSVGYSRAFFELFEGAIYMHQARQYLVTRLDLPRHRAYVRPVRVQYYTASRNHTDVNLTKKLETSEDGTVSSGCAQVVAKVWGYRKVWLQSNRIFETGVFSLPPLEYETRGFFIDLDIDVQREVESAGLCYVAGIHAVNHAFLAVTPLFLKCDAGDVETEHVYPFQQRPRPPRVVIYDKRPGGIGAAESLFSCIDDVLTKALALVKGCPCQDSPTGCPGCINDFKCSDYNVVLDKQAAVLILRKLIARRTAERQRAEAEAAAEHALAMGLDLEDEGGARAAVDAKLKPGQQEVTPRKAARQRALQMAKAMDGARARDLALQRSWVESFPNFRPEVD